MSEPPSGWVSPGGEPTPSGPAGPPPAGPPLPGRGGDQSAWGGAGWGEPGGSHADWGQPGRGQPAWGEAAWGQPAWGQPRPPEPKPGVVPLRPLALGELLDGAVALVRRYPRPVLGLSAAISIVATLLNITLAVTVFKPLIAFDLSALDNGGSSTTSEELDGLAGGALVGSLGSSLVTALATLVLTGVVTVIAGKGVLGEPISLGEAWSVVRSALLRLVGLALLTTLVVYGSMLLGIALAVLIVALGGAPAALLGVPLGIAAVCLAVHLYCRFALAPCAVILEHAGIRTGLRRSSVLVRGAWWRVFGVLLLALLVASVVGNVIQAPFFLFGLAPGIFGGRGLEEGTTRLLVLSYIGAGISQTIITPFTAGVRALLYVDRRMRAEGLDVALTAAAAQRVA